MPDYDSLNRADQWTDSAGNSPAEAWDLLGNDGRYYWQQGMAAPRIDHTGARSIDPTLKLSWEIVTAPSTGSIFFQYDLAAGGQGFVDIGAAVGSGMIEVSDHETDPETFRFAIGSSNVTIGNGLANGGVVALREIDDTFNSEYETDPQAETLQTLRNRLLLRTGYASQLSNLPPGVQLLYNDFLLSAQRFLYRKYKALQTERFFTYQLKPNERYYRFTNNVDEASVRLDPRKITRVEIQDLNDRWYPLARGINPQLYTLVDNHGWPERYEARDVFELFPAPQDYYKLRVKGQFGLQAFVDDDDYTTIDAEPVFLYALGLAKLQKGDRDAGDPARWTGFFGQAREYILHLIAEGHRNKRYVPMMRETVAMAQPTMIGIDW